MATFLELVHEVERESGTVSQSQRVVTAANPVGRHEKIVRWTAKAWEMIQRERRDWTFRRCPFEGDLQPGKVSYSGTDLGISDLSQWEKHPNGHLSYTLYDPATGRADETRLVMLPFPDWAQRFDIGVHDANRPLYVAIGYSNRLHFGPTPDKAYKARGWYTRGIQTLRDDSDTPYIAPEFHEAIVWRAKLLLAEHDGAPEDIITSLGNYRAAYSAMLREYTEEAEVS